jgi:hypothetical protein
MATPFHTQAATAPRQNFRRRQRRDHDICLLNKIVEICEKAVA